jgi:putative cell wall-binding protein
VATATELKRLKPAKIIVLGGTSVIGSSVERQLNAYATG